MNGHMIYAVLFPSEILHSFGTKTVVESNDSSPMKYHSKDTQLQLSYKQDSVIR